MNVTVQKYGLNGLNGPFFKKEMALKDIFHSGHYINSSFGHSDLNTNFRLSRRKYSKNVLLRRDKAAEANL